MSVKTETQIERDFYSMLKTSSLGTELKGSIYRDEMRPANAKTEDLVLKMIAGTDEQIQEGIIVCNIYVPDVLQKGGKPVKDFDRIGKLQAKALELIGCTSEYKIRTDGSPVTIAVDGIAQHMINLRLRFERIID